MRDKLGRSRGFGFVIFDENDVGEIIGNNHTLDGRMIEVKKAIPKNEIKTKKLFVGGIPLTLSEEKFKKYFQQFGKVTEWNIMKDRQTGQPRGFGFVSFEQYDTIDQVLEMNHFIAGKKVEVKVAEPKKFRDTPNFDEKEDFSGVQEVKYPQYFTPTMAPVMTPHHIPTYQPSYQPQLPYVDMYANQMNMGYNSVFSTNFPSFVPPTSSSSRTAIPPLNISVPVFSVDSNDTIIKEETRSQSLFDQDLSKVVGGHRMKKRTTPSGLTHQSLFLNDILDGRDERHSFSGFRDFAEEFGILLDTAEEGSKRNTWS